MLVFIFSSGFRRKKKKELCGRGLREGAKSSQQCPCTFSSFGLDVDRWGFVLQEPLEKTCCSFCGMNSGKALTRVVVAANGPRVAVINYACTSGVAACVLRRTEDLGVLEAPQSCVAFKCRKNRVRMDRWYAAGVTAFV